MATDFARTMARLPDEALFDIAHPDIGEDYAPEAMAAAKAEIDRRGISYEEGRQIRYDLYQEREAKLPLDEEPLGKSGRVASMVFAFCVLPMLFVIAMLHILGYRQKARDTAWGMVKGWICYFALASTAVALVALFDWLSRLNGAAPAL